MKKIISVFLSALLILSLGIITSAAGTTIAIGPSDFSKQLGSWKLLDAADGTLDDKMLEGETNGIVSSVSAIIGFNVSQPGRYNMFVLTKDFPTYPGMRFFDIAVNHKSTKKKFGIHGGNGWAWEGPIEVNLTAGANAIAITDTSAYYARFGGVIFQLEGSLPSLEDKEAINAFYEANKASVTAPPAPVEKIYQMSSDGSISFYVNEEQVPLVISPVVIDGTVMLPVREVFESFGAVIEWDAVKQQINVTRNNVKAVFKSGDDHAKVDNIQALLGAKIVTQDGTAMAPMRLFTSLLGGTAEWIEKSNVISFEGDYGTVETVVTVTDKWFLNYESYDDLGTWMSEQYMGSYPNVGNLRGLAGQSARDARPAVATINVQTAGSYHVWVRSRDFATNQPGSRYFHISVNNKRSSNRLGRHGTDGFKWEYAGAYTMPVGNNKVELIDSSGFYPRCDGVYISSENVAPPEGYNDIISIVPPHVSPTGGRLAYPKWINDVEEPAEILSIQNETVKVDFFKVEGDSGDCIQRQTSILENGVWIPVDRRSDGLVYLVLFADTTVPRGVSESLYQPFEIRVDGNIMQSYNIYDVGKPYWAIPQAMSIINGKLVMNAVTAVTDLEISWELPAGYKEPLVTIKSSMKKTGTISMGIYNTPQITDDSYTNLLIPFAFDSKRKTQGSMLISEQNAYTPMSTISISEELSPIKGKKFTYGLAVDPASINNSSEWIYGHTAKFALGNVGMNKEAQPSLFAPMFGNQAFNFNAGDVYSFSYRPIAYVGDWYETFRHVNLDILKLKDYRSNYFSSMTDAIFNVTDLMMDDLYGGWDRQAKQYYDMEGRNATSQANVIQALQSFLISDDHDILERRAIPTLASLISRTKTKFYHGGSMHKTTDYFYDWFTEGQVARVGSPIDTFNAPTYVAAHNFIFGTNGAFMKTALERANGVSNEYAVSIPSYSDKIWAYKATGDKRYYDEAVAEADDYIKSNVHATLRDVVGYHSFAYTAYYPHFQSLMDMYEVTGEKRFLDAAEDVGRRVATFTWNTGMTDVTPNMEFTIPGAGQVNGIHNNNDTLWWHGDFQWRMGNEYNDLTNLVLNNPIEDVTVPIWVTSRVGLGLEGAGSFGGSAHVPMQHWAPELMRLAHFTGDKFFETIARNAMVGRYANYPGYYIAANSTVYMQADYPYTGPEITSPYYHHIPPFLAILEDFIISQAYLWSDAKIDFPYVRNQGYAFLENRQYGFAPGKFFDINDVWLWMKRGILESDNMNIDYITAKKNDTLCITLMNESEGQETVNIQLGDEVPGASTLNTVGTLYNKNGEKQDIVITNGSFSVTIAPRELAGVKIDIPGLKEPTFAALYNMGVCGKTAKHITYEFDFGKAYSFQMQPDKYFAYIYLTETDMDASVVTLEYTVGGVTKTETCEQYPYEFIIEVDAKDIFNFKVRTDGTPQKTASGRLQSILK